jgi:hypothetical protein
MKIENIELQEDVLTTALQLLARVTEINNAIRTGARTSIKKNDSEAKKKMDAEDPQQRKNAQLGLVCVF